MALWNVFSEIVADALKLAERTGLSLPSYAIDLVPRLCYKLSPEDPPFLLPVGSACLVVSHCSRHDPTQGVH